MTCQYSRFNWLKNAGILYKSDSTAQLFSVNKVHILIDHVPDFCEAKQKGLGYFSEQASEAVHCNFKNTFKNMRQHF